MTLTKVQQARLAKRVRPERRAYQVAWYARRRDHVRARQRAKYLRNREVILNAVRNRKYGVTDEWVATTYATQCGQCAICSQGIESRSAHIDHDHTSGRARGLLCARCNLRLGVLEDKLFVPLAFKYLGRFA